MDVEMRKGGTDSSLRELLDREFDGTPGLMEEFPILVGPENRARRFVMEQNGRTVAHTAWRSLVLRSGPLRLPAAGIGLVTTHRDWRGRGLATRLVEECVQDARSQGACLALLFAPPRALYSRLGFRPAGQERMTRPNSGAASVAFRRGNPEDASRLLPLLDAHSVGVDRSVSEFETLLRVPGTHLHVLEEGGRLAAYCIEGRGRDLRGVIHEWAGDPPALTQLLGAVTAEPDGPEWILSPGSSTPPLEGTHHSVAMAQIRILDAPKVGTDDPVEAFGDPDHPGRIPIYVWGLDSV